MATIEDRPFSRDYSGLINQSVLAVCIATLCLSSHEYMKRKRRGKYKRGDSLGSVESWQFGYLYQGRCWAKTPSPSSPRGSPLSWVKQAITFPETELIKLRGVDATLYCRFLRGCFYFTLLHTVTTTLILLPIHIHFSSGIYPIDSMNRALISSLVQTPTGRSLLWIHLVLLLWVSVSWIFTILWVCRGAFHFRALAIEEASRRAQTETQRCDNSPYSPHPHPQHPFHTMPPIENDSSTRGHRLRTVMVTNIPARLRSEKELKEYFHYYMSRPLAKPALGVTGSSQPGFFNKSLLYLYNHARKSKFFQILPFGNSAESSGQATPAARELISDAAVNRVQQEPTDSEPGMKPLIERVVVARKMTELASLVDRREDILAKLEAAHVKLARKAFSGVKHAAREREQHINGQVKPSTGFLSLLQVPLRPRDTAEKPTLINSDAEQGNLESDGIDVLIDALGPFVDKLGKNRPEGLRDLVKRKFVSHSHTPMSLSPTPSPFDNSSSTIWDVLFSLPRHVLNPYQPLIHLSVLFRGKTVPAIDFYTAKLGLLTSLITESRSRAAIEFEPVSTAFVTFANPEDARRACQYLAVHPENPLTCLVTMAPDFEDLDWVRVMKSTFKAEIVKDWVIGIGVWAWTILWVIPVSLFVGLVSIQNIASRIPSLQNFLNKHKYLSNVLQNFVPTLLVSLLMLLIPVILLFIAKKAHTINTLSALHDRIMTRYHKFLIANILVFFCVGLTALESFFTSFKSSLNIPTVVGESFPSAGPFYVGWVIFTTAMHGGLEIALFGLPLILYPSTKHQVTPRKRAVGIRPRTFNYYYWLPNHLLVLFVTLLFCVLNPLLTPFALIYYSAQNAVIRNQLLHVYAKNYEGNGKLLLIRMVRYSLDGVMLAQVAFLGFSAVVKKSPLVALTAVFIAGTALTKIILTRVCRAKFEEADMLEASIITGALVLRGSGEHKHGNSAPPDMIVQENQPIPAHLSDATDSMKRFMTWKLPKGHQFNYTSLPPRAHSPHDRKPNPFAPEVPPIGRFNSWNGAAAVADPDRSPSGKSSYEYDRKAAASSPNLALTMTGSPLAEEPVQMGTADPVLERHPLVTRHEKHPNWDDSSRLDRPYDNPYYARPITNHLWLPRDPIGLLDLDDTVNVFRALTTDPSSGQLGEWMEEGVALPELPLTSRSLDPSDPEAPPSRMLTGDEEILLPPVIADRVKNINDKDDVEHADESSSLFRPRRPSVATTSTGTRRRGTFSSYRANTFDAPFRLVSRTSRGSLPRFSPRTPTSTVPTARLRSMSVNVDPAAEPDLFAQARFVPDTVISGLPSVGSSPYQRSDLSLPNTPQQPVTTREAVVGEVIAEERQATESRLREEAAEGTERNRPLRNWWTAWLFARALEQRDTAAEEKRDSSCQHEM